MGAGGKPRRRKHRRPELTISCACGGGVLPGLSGVPPGLSEVLAGLIEVPAGLVEVPQGLIEVPPGLSGVLAGLIEVLGGLSGVPEGLRLILGPFRHKTGCPLSGIGWLNLLKMWLLSRFHPSISLPTGAFCPPPSPLANPPWEASGPNRRKRSPLHPGPWPVKRDGPRRGCSLCGKPTAGLERRSFVLDSHLGQP